MAKYLCRNEHFWVIYARSPSRYACLWCLEVGAARQVDFFVCAVDMMVMSSVERRQHLGFDHGQCEQEEKSMGYRQDCT